MHTYDTITEAVNGLKKRGYAIDFNIEADRIFCKETALGLSPAEFDIAEVYRFQKGILVNGFGPSADAVGEEMVEKLRMKS